MAKKKEVTKVEDAIEVTKVETEEKVDTVKEVTTENLIEDVNTEIVKEEVEITTEIEPTEDTQEDTQGIKNDEGTDKDITVATGKEKAEKDNKKMDRGLLGCIGVLLIIVLLFGVLAFSQRNVKPTVVGSSNSLVEENKLATEENISVLTDAVANLKTKESYLVTTYLTMGGTGSAYIDVVEPNGSYTMYNATDDSLAFQDAVMNSETGVVENYILNDFLDKEGNLYFLSDSQDSEGNLVTELYKTPDTYGEATQHRTVMYADWVVPNLKNVVFKEEVTTDYGDGEVKMSVYEGNVSSEIVKDIFGHGSYSLYAAVEESTQSEGMKKLMGWLKDDAEFTMYFSDANVLLGVVNGTLTYMNFEVGGLGTRMYLTKCVLLDGVVDDYIVKEYPDTTNALTYEDLYADLGEMALEYDSIDALYNAVNSQYSMSEEEMQEYLNQIYANTETYMTEDGKMYMFDGTTWVDETGNVAEILIKEDGTYETSDGVSLQKVESESLEVDVTPMVEDTVETTTEEVETVIEETVVAETIEVIE